MIPAYDPEEEMNCSRCMKLIEAGDPYFLRHGHISCSTECADLRSSGILVNEKPLPYLDHESQMMRDWDRTLDRQRRERGDHGLT